MSINRLSVLTGVCQLQIFDRKRQKFDFALFFGCNFAKFVSKSVESIG